MPILADFTFGDALLTGLEFALLFIWIWIAVGVIFDIFRSHDLSGWGKAAWLFLVFILPMFGVLIYLIVRGHNMHERAALDAQRKDAAVRDYIRTTASTPADDIAKLSDLHTRGVISDDEFAKAKAKALA
ncbi:MAG TPA: PLDc N-terminal domain-containing protein [Solirubrobacteraceae bacterium]|jgi:hypothetical protein